MAGVSNPGPELPPQAPDEYEHEADRDHNQRPFILQHLRRAIPQLHETSRRAIERALFEHSLREHHGSQFVRMARDYLVFGARSPWPTL